MTGSGKIGDAALIAAMDMGGERAADGAECRPMRRGRGDGEVIGVGTDLLQAESA